MLHFENLDSKHLNFKQEQLDSFRNCQRFIIKEPGFKNFADFYRLIFGTPQIQCSNLTPKSAQNLHSAIELGFDCLDSAKDFIELQIGYCFDEEMPFVWVTTFTLLQEKPNFGLQLVFSCPYFIHPPSITELEFAHFLSKRYKQLFVTVVKQQFSQEQFSKISLFTAIASIVQESIFHLQQLQLSYSISWLID